MSFDILVLVDALRLERSNNSAQGSREARESSMMIEPDLICSIIYSLIHFFVFMLYGDLSASCLFTIRYFDVILAYPIYSPLAEKYFEAYSYLGCWDMGS